MFSQLYLGFNGHFRVARLFTLKSLILDYIEFAFYVKHEMSVNITWNVYYRLSKWETILI